MEPHRVDPKPKRTEQAEDKLKNVHSVHGSLVTKEPIVHVWMNAIDLTRRKRITSLKTMLKTRGVLMSPNPELKQAVHYLELDIPMRGYSEYDMKKNASIMSGMEADSSGSIVGRI